MATIVIPNFLTEKVVNGLNTYTYTVGSASMHTCRIEVDHRDTSTLSIAITQAGSVNATLATATLPGSSNAAGSPQSAFILMATANCQVSDVISFVLTSSAAIDQGLNNVKARLKVTVGGLN
jgi:hypothetical protein